MVICFTSLVIQARGAIKYDSIKILIEDQAITKNEIEIRAVELARVRTGKQPNAELIGEFRKEAINQLVEESLLDAKAEELQILIGEEDLDRELAQFRSQRRINELEFEELLERQNISLSDFRKTYKRQILRNRVIAREISSKINISEESLKTEYEKSASGDELVRARHILILVSKNASDDKVSLALKKINDLRNRVLEGESFVKIADLYSEDPSVKTNHGDLGFFKKNEMVKEFADAAFSLEKGKISEPVRSPFGFHLIEVLESKKEMKEPFETVKNKLRQQEYQKQFQELYLQYIATLKSNASIIFK